MLNLSELEMYHENNRIEAKKATGGFPRSLWETYSAFANTIGGYILLGVEELEGHVLHACGLISPETLIKELWNTLNNPEKVSTNILCDSDVSIEEIDGKRIIVIHVPRANRHACPVYIGGNVMTGTYRRNGEGDYHCTPEEIKSMLREQGDASLDLRVLENMSLVALDADSIKRYRIRMANNRPGHVWEGIPDDDFLYRLGAAGRMEEQAPLHPTAAGLLMFGHEYEIVKEFPQYFLDYRECMDASLRWTDRIVSSSGDWSGNIFDFYFRVYNKIVQDIKIPFVLENGRDRVDDTPVHQALREALANALIHADYYDRQGLVIEKRPNVITIGNPGGLRVNVEQAIIGGRSDPRNATLVKMFNLIGIGERAGSGIPNIHSVWEKQKWTPPVWEESFNPDRTVLTLLLVKKTPIMTADKKPPIKTADNIESATLRGQKRQVIQYLTDHITCTSADICALLKVRDSRAKEILRELVKRDYIVPEGGNRNRTYRLKS